MRPLITSGFALVLTAALVVASPALAQGKGVRPHVGGGKGNSQDLNLDRIQEFNIGRGADNGNSGGSTGDTGGLPPGLAKQNPLPHGLAKRDELPPGLAKGHSTPPGLAKRNQLPPGLRK